MTTTAEEPVTEVPATDPEIDVELPAATAGATAPAADADIPMPMIDPDVAGPAAPPQIDFVASPGPAVIQPSRAARSPQQRRGNRRTKVTVRRFGLLSVFKFALIFSLCLAVVVWLALMLIYFLLDSMGVTENIAYIIGCVIQPPEGTKACVAAGIDAVKLFTYLFFSGIVMAAAAAVLWTFIALIYNLIADIVGGVEVVLAEKR